MDYNLFKKAKGQTSLFALFLLKSHKEKWFPHINGLAINYFLADLAGFSASAFLAAYAAGP